MNTSGWWPTARRRPSPRRGPRSIRSSGRPRRPTPTIASRCGCAAPAIRSTPNRPRRRRHFQSLRPQPRHRHHRHRHHRHRRATATGAAGTGTNSNTRDRGHRGDADVQQTLPQPAGTPLSSRRKRSVVSVHTSISGGSSMASSGPPSAAGATTNTMAWARQAADPSYQVAVRARSAGSTNADGEATGDRALRAEVRPTKLGPAA